MTYIPDLAELSYSGLKGPIRAVGWLKSEHAYSRASIDPDFYRRLMTLISRPIWGLGCLGLHWCSLCAVEGRIGPDGRSSQNIVLIPASNCVYEAPIWIGHYVMGHSYSPPDEFCLAVMSCPEPGSDEMRRALLEHLPQLADYALDGLPFFGEWDVQATLDPSPEHGSEPNWEKIKLESEPSPTREHLVQEHGGLSEVLCVWVGCDNRALANMAICFEHAYPEWAK